MPEPSSPLPAPIEPRRQRTITLLCQHYANDTLNADELEQRLDLAHQAASLAELDALLTDLPALAEPGAGRAVGTLARADPLQVAETDFIIAIMSGTERKGVWTPARQLNAFAVMGGFVLDFRQARFSPGVTELNFFALMGGGEIIVPPGVRVETSVIPIMGGAEVRTSETTDPDAPVLRIRGLAIMGGLEVKERLPGETAKEAKQRIREAQREQRRLTRGG